MRNYLAYLIPVLAIAGVARCMNGPEPDRQADRYDPAYCAGPRLNSTAELAQAREEGYEIDRDHHCIRKDSYAAVNLQKAEWEQRQHQQASRPAEAADEVKQTLSGARQGFMTQVHEAGGEHLPFPKPPSDLFVRSDYRSGDLDLAAYVTADPGDGRKHPAIIWITGGDYSSLDDFWSPQPVERDQTARAFREAGMVMMFPTFRGGNRNPGDREFFYGEVDDVMAAAEALAKLPYVDPGRIYLGGHSTGGTLALLAAESGNRFRAVFAFGPVGSPDVYPREILPVNLDGDELRLRSPEHWLDGITRPTFLIEGENPPSNAGEVGRMCRSTRNPMLHCAIVPGQNHFSVLYPLTVEIAKQLTTHPAGYEYSLHLTGQTEPAGR